MAETIALVAAAWLSLTNPFPGQMPPAYMVPYQTVVIVPAIDKSDVRANGALMPHQRAQVTAFVQDGHGGDIYAFVSPPNGLPGVVKCEGLTAIQTADWKLIGIC